MHLVSVRNEKFPVINPRYLGWRDCTPSLKRGPLVQTCWFLYYVVSGCGTFQIGQRSYRVESGHMFCFPPNTEVCYQADDQDPWSYIWVGFDGPGELPVKLGDVIECPGALRFFTAMRICQVQGGGRSAYICARIWDLFAYLAERQPTPSDYIDQALAYMQGEYIEGITVTDIAQRLNMDRSHFTTRFKKRVGVSPKKYLMDLRMRVAATLLSDGHSVGVTATSVGYGDIYTFSKMFRRFHGTSPTEYAKRDPASKKPL